MLKINQNICLINDNVRKLKENEASLKFDKKHLIFSIKKCQKVWEDTNNKKIILLYFYKLKMKNQTIILF